jgi:hypothetical protein
MVAMVLYREKYIYSDDAVREMVLWQLRHKTPARPHGLKYRLYYGLKYYLPVPFFLFLFKMIMAINNHKNFFISFKLYLSINIPLSTEYPEFAKIVNM